MKTTLAILYAIEGLVIIGLGVCAVGAALSGQTGTALLAGLAITIVSTVFIP